MGPTFQFHYTLSSLINVKQTQLESRESHLSADKNQSNLSLKLIILQHFNCWTHIFNALHCVKFKNLYCNFKDG